MQETQVTVDGTTHVLERPFLVIATQNPVEYEGTYPLPEAQLDRFAVRMTIGYPPLGDEARMLAEQTTEPPLDTLRPVAGTRGARRRRSPRSRRVHVDESVNRYVVALLRHTRASTRLALGRRARARGSRCCGSRRRAHSSSAATSSCPTTSRRSPSPCSRIG